MEDSTLMSPNGIIPIGDTEPLPLWLTGVLTLFL